LQAKSYKKGHFWSSLPDPLPEWPQIFPLEDSAFQTFSCFEQGHFFFYLFPLLDLKRFIAQLSGNLSSAGTGILSNTFTAFWDHE
jgi:hypothetical protein